MGTFPLVTVMKGVEPFWCQGTSEGVHALDCVLLGPAFPLQEQ